MKKRIYRRMPVNQFQPSSISLDEVGARLVFAVDVAKVDMVAAIAGDDGRVLNTIAWKAPRENAAVLGILQAFRAAGFLVEVAMEPSGTYGDVLQYHLEKDGFPIFMVSGKRTYDARELYDGVPSLHDAKSAAIIARLHLEGLSKPACAPCPERRQLHAAITIMELHQRRYLQLVGNLESWLARHWPELPALVDLTAASLMALLARIGGPADVAAQRSEAEKLLHGISRGLMDKEKITAILDSAGPSVGVPLMGMERNALMEIAAEAHRALRAFKGAKTELEKLAAPTPAAAMAPVIGRTTAAIVYTDVGDANLYSSAGSFVKAMGMNLKEKSSGTIKGQIKITKRGSSRVRHYLWLAVFRWIQKDPIANAWYERKVKRDGGKSSRAAVVLMRKLAKALYYVGRGAPFESSKLFDVRRLELAA